MYVPTYLPTYLPTLHVPTWPTFLPIYLPTVGVMSRKFETKNVENDFNVCCSDLRGQMKGKISRSCVKEFQRERERECVCDLCGFEVCGSEWERERERERERVRESEKERERDLYVCAILRLEFRSATPFSFILFSHSKIAPFVGSFFYLPLTI